MVLVLPARKERVQMPELPEVETVRRGLAPFLAGARILSVRLARPGLRFPFPPDLGARIKGARIETVGRRAKYLLLSLSSGETVLSHLGMTGTFRLSGTALSEPSRLNRPPADAKHEHMVWGLEHPLHGRFELVYADPRRFGFLDLFADPDASPFLAGLGPEPLSNGFSAQGLAERLAGRRAPIKAMLLDQRVVAGLGNIYVCEALFRAGIAPGLAAGRLVMPGGGPSPRLEALVPAVRQVLEEAIAAGGSSLRDFHAADGAPGYFQHRFEVYGREGASCVRPGCGGTVARIVQSGRSSFFCPACQSGESG